MFCGISHASSKMRKCGDGSIRSKKRLYVNIDLAGEYEEVTEINPRKGKELFINRKFPKVFHSALASKSVFSDAFCHRVL